jgi:D-alanine-D-alanine ligase
MSKIKLGVIFGGQSTEHDVSVVSGTSVIKNLSKEKYEINPIYISKEGTWYKYTKDINVIDILEIGENPKELEKITNIVEELQKLDVVFPVLHGLYGEDGTVQGMLELLKIPYVGCKVLASSICMNKIYTKMVLEKAQIKQAKAVIINKSFDGKIIYIDESLNHQEKDEKEICDIVNKKLGYPVFIKPSNSGSSVGVNKAKNGEELIKYIDEAAKFDKEILIEEAINGKEIECAVLGNEDAKASCVGQVLSADEFYDYESKYKNAESKTIIPAEIEESISEKIRETAVKAFKAVGGTGLARVDFFVDKNTSEIYLNEINTMPGFTNISMYPKLWGNVGLRYENLLDELIQLAMKK